MTPEDARATLAALATGALDQYLTAEARERLRADAVAAEAVERSTPTARVVAITSGKDGVRTVTVVCPFCPPPRSGRQATHVHGWPRGEREPGVRTAHCAQTAGLRSYRIVLDSSAVA